MKPHFIEFNAAGFLDEPVKIKVKKNGEEFAIMRFGVNYSFVDKETGEWVTKTQYYPVVSFKHIEFLKTLEKGDMLLVIGVPRVNRKDDMDKLTLVADTIGLLPEPIQPLAA
jgi:Single-strand binding protein family